MKQLIALVLIVIVGIGCTDEPTPPPEIPGVVLMEDISNDREDVSRREEFYYDKNHRLIRHRIKQVFTVRINGYVDTDSLSLENRVDYAPNEVTVTDAFDNVSVYTLNKDGYASRCTRREGGGSFIRNYTFGYSADSTLVEVTEIINETVWSRIVLHPTTEKTATLSVLSGETDNNTFQLTLNETNTSLVPWLYLAELHPLALHQEALYAQLLGKAPMWLVQSIEPQGGDEKVTYTYKKDSSGNLSSCSITTRSEGVNYDRTVRYSINPEKR